MANNATDYISKAQFLLPLLQGATTGSQDAQNQLEKLLDMIVQNADVQPELFKSEAGGMLSQVQADVAGPKGVVPPARFPVAQAVPAGAIVAPEKPSDEVTEPTVADKLAQIGKAIQVPAAPIDNPPPPPVTPPTPMQLGQVTGAGGINLQQLLAMIQGQATPAAVPSFGQTLLGR